MRKATLSDVQARLQKYIKTSAAHPVLILADGEPVAMLVGLRPDKKRRPTKLREILKRAWKEYQKHGGMTHEEFWKDLANKDVG